MEKRNDHSINLNYFIEHQDELVAKYNGKRLLMHNAEVVGAFDTLDEAVEEGHRLFGRGNYSIQKCKPGPGAYTIGVPYWMMMGAPACT